MLKLPKKLMITLMATATVLGVGTGIGQLPSASARHVRTYSVRRHRTYRHRRTARHLTKRTRRTKRTKRTKRIRYTKRARRSARKYRRYHLVYRAAKARKPKRSRRYVRKHVRHRIARKSSRRFNIYRDIPHAKLAKWAKFDGVSIPQLVKYTYNVSPLNHNGQPIKAYNIKGDIQLFTDAALKHVAHGAGLSVKQYLGYNVAHGSKYYYANGFTTPYGFKVMDRDAIKDLNKQRAAVGSGPVTQDPDLQFIAQKHAEMIDNYTNKQEYLKNVPFDYHIGSNGLPIALNIAHKYNLPIAPAGENCAYGSFGSNFDSPSEDAQSENDYSWDAGHKALRDNPAYSSAGIAITNGAIVEEYA